MLFIHNPKLRRLEAFMQEVPFFPSKWAKVDFDRLEDEITLFEIERITVSLKHNKENKGKDEIMRFRNEQHRNTYLKEVKNQSLSNYKLIAALYLLTADSKLWDTAKEFVGKDDIVFESIHLRNGSESSYALYCAAKDLYNGSRHLAIDDIADTGLIKGKAFALICNAMQIKRKGLAAVITMEAC
ncbi:MAG: hypothetical protein NC203_07790 [Firmicutes bacterium]|nr:hypothetical protein [[Eubacterium] siraeum]MCM1488251.1 hypothetical protein [Bacillota bacterium]